MEKKKHIRNLRENKRKLKRSEGYSAKTKKKSEGWVNKKWGRREI